MADEPNQQRKMIVIENLKALQDDINATAVDAVKNFGLEVKFSVHQRTVHSMSCPVLNLIVKEILISK